MNENTQFFLKTFYCIQIFIRFIESTELILFLAPLKIYIAYKSPLRFQKNHAKLMNNSALF